MMNVKVKYVYIKMLNKNNTFNYWFGIWGELSKGRSNVWIGKLSKETRDFLDSLKTDKARKQMYKSIEG